MTPKTEKPKEAAAKPEPAPAVEDADANAGDQEPAGDTATLEQLQEQLDEKTAAIAELQNELEQRNAAIAELEKQPAAAAAVASGERRTVTYLGRPDQIAVDAEGEPTEEDVYVSVDHADAGKGIRLGVGETAIVSAEKAAQLEADFPDAFEVS